MSWGSLIQQKGSSCFIMTLCGIHLLICIQRIKEFLAYIELLIVGLKSELLDGFS